jgi:hypothetical protein
MENCEKKIHSILQCILKYTFNISLPNLVMFTIYIFCPLEFEFFFCFITPFVAWNLFWWIMNFHHIIYLFYSKVMIVSHQNIGGSKISKKYSTWFLKKLFILVTMCWWSYWNKSWKFYLFLTWFYIFDVIYFVFSKL